MAALGEDLLSTVNKLQDLVFNTIGSDSLDLPQIVSLEDTFASAATFSLTVLFLHRLSSALSRQVNRLSSKILLAATFCQEAAAS